MDFASRARAWSRSKLSPESQRFPSGSLAPVEVQARGLACLRGGPAVFADLSFLAPAGRLLAVTGPNGAGKTSLLRMIAGLIRPEAGELRIAAALPWPEHRRMGEEPPSLHLLGHLDGLKPALSLRETLHFWAALFGERVTPARCVAAADRVGLAHALDLPVGVLSAGQRRRAGMARLVIAPRPLWLLDEPASALDRDGEALLAALMAEHLALGGTIIAATHQPLPVAPHAGLDMALFG